MSTYERLPTALDLAAPSGAPEITEGMSLGVVMQDKRYIYRVDSAEKTRQGYHLNVTLLETQTGTPVQD